MKKVELLKAIRLHFPNNENLENNQDDHDYSGMLENVWNKLQEDEIFTKQYGPYPANHGLRHITTVLYYLSELIKSFKNMRYLEKFEIFVAGMIHDIVMTKICLEGAYSEQSEKIRFSHSELKEIDKLARPFLEKNLDNYQDRNASITRIIKIAYGHAGDKIKSAKEKENDNEICKDTFTNHLIRDMRILRLADFLDLGRDRLGKGWENEIWRGNQLNHLKKHLVLSKDIDPESRKIVVKRERKNFNIKEPYEKPYEIKASSLEILALLRTVHEELLSLIKDVNEKIEGGDEWYLEPLDERLFGQVWPLSAGVGLFTRVLDEELPCIDGLPLKMDLMGHSLSGRFVEDHENLNEKLKRLFREGNLKMRILLLDPHIENQQMCEVFEAQMELERDKNRCILPRYKNQKDGQLVLDDKQKGDILETLDKISKEWANDDIVGARSSLEVRLTNRLLYMSLSRYGNTIIITPYSSRGLFNSSIGLLYGKQSEMSSEYLEEFESIWDSTWETRLYLLTGLPNSVENPIPRLISPYLTNDSTIPALDYERYFIKENIDRTIVLFDHISDKSNPPPSPVEIEIQPSARCNLNCRHCVGIHLFRGDGISQSANTQTLSLNFLDDLLSWDSGGFKVDRFRVSGLLGDPLYDDATIEFTLNFLDKAKQHQKYTVLFTNGLGLTKITSEKDINRLLSANNIHVSLDASNSNSFILQKSAGPTDFNEICAAVENLCRKTRDLGPETTRIGLGFVVNEKNVFEIEDAIRLAKDIKARFIRFKPDIRAPKALPWRVWREAEKKIVGYPVRPDDNLEIVLTNVAWHHSGRPSPERCWAQYLFASVAPSGGVHVCDHLTESNGETCIGNLHDSNIHDLWKQATSKPDFGKRTSQCRLCPPFNWRINRLLDQLFVLYKQYGAKMLKDWVEAALM